MEPDRVGPGAVPGGRAWRRPRTAAAALVDSADDLPDGLDHRRPGRPGRRVQPGRRPADRHQPAPTPWAATSARCCRCATPTSAAGGPRPSPTAACPPARGTPSARCTCPTAPSCWSASATCAARAAGPREGWHREPGAVRRVMITLRGTEQRARLERSRADLVSTVAHELRSPLTSVKGFTATLLAKWPRFTDDQKRVMLETVNADADRVTRLITELLDVSRIEAGPDRGAPRAGRHPGPGPQDHQRPGRGGRRRGPVPGRGGRGPARDLAGRATRSTRSWPT